MTLIWCRCRRLRKFKSQNVATDLITRQAVNNNFKAVCRRLVGLKMSSIWGLAGINTTWATEQPNYSLAGTHLGLLQRSRLSGNRVIHVTLWVSDAAT
jgi:hypothetical protein